MSDQLLKSLPPIPLPESKIDQIADAENVTGWESTLAHFQPEIGEEMVFNFVIGISGSWYALVLGEDGESGWKSLGEFSTFSEAGMAISDWRKKNGLRFD